jgi:hypothetical protein
VNTPHRPGHHGDRARQLGADAYFAIVPEWVLWHPELSPGAVRLFGTLQRRTNEHDHAFPGRAWLAERCNVSKNTIDRWMGELVGVGAVDKRRRWDPEAGEYLTSLYVLRMVGPSPAVGTSGPTREATPSHAGVESPHPADGDRSRALQGEPDQTDPESFTDEDQNPTRAAFLEELERRRRRRQPDEPEEEAS